MDGAETLTVVTAHVYSQPDNVFATDLSLNSVPIQLEQIAEWVNQKFGSIILENSCAICNADYSVVPVDNSTVGGNSTGGVPVVTGFFDKTNYTLPNNCSFSNDVTVYCQSPMNSGYFNFTSMNSLYNDTVISTLATEMESVVATAGDNV